MSTGCKRTEIGLWTPIVFLALGQPLGLGDIAQAIDLEFKGWTSFLHNVWVTSWVSRTKIFNYEL